MIVRESRRSRLRGLTPVLAIAACALGSVGAPAVASATIYTVDSTADEADANPGAEGCKTAGAHCTLRAAIEESNLSAGPDEIEFAAAFNGQLADTINLGGSLPSIIESVHIDGDKGGQCTTEAASVKGPCVGVKAAGGTFPFTVQGDGVTIEGLAITEGLAGIRVINATENFTARDNWLGVTLKGENGGSGEGIFVDPNSNGATIGGVNAADRNVIANTSGDGLDLKGASVAKVQGNYFGVKPDGVTPAANGKDIEVTDSTAGGGIKAARDEIGAEVGAEGAATPACDHGCNVLVSSAISEAAIDLRGNGGEEVPASGPTTIHGNYVGIDATGAAAAQGADKGILVGGSDKALIGGSGVGDANHIILGTYAILAGIGADDLVVDGNLIGLNPAGTATLSPPSADGIFDSSEGITSFDHFAQITDNRIAMIGGIAIEQHSSGALIAGNVLGRGLNGEILSAGTTGIKVWGSIGGSTVKSNLIEEAAGNGILIENSHNVVVGNVVEGAGLAGIRIQNFLTLPSVDNLIGNDSEEEENEISGSGGAAIEVADEEDDAIIIRRNFGNGNAGLFIDLGADGPGNQTTGPNEGIQAPVIAKATTLGVSGNGALGGADIRVFEKATAANGEIKGFLGKVKADGGGSWELAYDAKIPVGTNVGVTQTGVEGTSELAVATTEAEKTGGGEGQGGGNGGGGNNGGGGKGGTSTDTTPPQTTIRKGTKGKTHSTTAKFKFDSSEVGSTFECKLDRKPFKPCRSPKKYGALKPGKHVFKVRAVDAAGNLDQSPAKRAFSILG